MATLTISDVNILFDELWPLMPYNQTHKENIISHLPKIKKLFIIHGRNYDMLLLALKEISGVGLVIATGLIWSVYPDDAVPFDKYTMTYALHKNIISSNIISSNNRYSKASMKIKDYCDFRNMTIEDFVRDAIINFQQEIATSPI